jgi:N-acetylglucosamine kinase-like BadF-type ATPase
VSRYVIAADGGNSKTDLVLATTGGRIVSRVRGRGTHPHIDGIESMAADLAGLARRAVAQAGLSERTTIVAATFHLANLDLPGEERAAATALHRAGVAGAVTAANDTIAVLRAGCPDGWGVAVVSGAGVNAMGRHPNGRVARFLALGEITGDWGGGYRVGLAGLGAAVRAGDGRGARTVLAERIAAHFDRPTAEAVAIAVHRREITHSQLQGLAPVVFDAADGGDGVAGGIVVRLADEVATMATALLRRLRLLRADAPVVLGGGTLQTPNALLHRRIAEQLARTAPRARPAMLDVSPVAGTVTEALELAGARPTAVRHARTQLRHH